jgi:hypothetical protein
MNLKEGNRLNWFIFIQSETFNFATPLRLGEAMLFFHHSPLTATSFEFTTFKPVGTLIRGT